MENNAFFEIFKLDRLSIETNIGRLFDLADLDGELDVIVMKKQVTILPRKEGRND